jgi:hypothetical protein
MSWTITPQYRGAAVSDPDAQAYLRAVETADGQPLEPAVALAVNNFVIGCKSDGTWTALKASCILSGARKKEGAFIDLKTATQILTNNGFADADYNRKTGLVGNGSSKYLNSNILASALGATSHALLAYGALTRNTGDATLLGRFNGTTGPSLISLDEWASYVNGRAFRSGTFLTVPIEFPVSTVTATATCMIGSRTSSTSATLFVDGVSITNTTNLSLSTAAQPLYVFALNINNTTPGAFSSSRVQIYAIFDSGLTSSQAGTLRANTTALINAFAAAIP